MPINRNKQGTARCILTHFLPVGIPRLEYPSAPLSSTQIKALSTKEDKELKEDDGNTENHCRHGTDEIDCIPADEKTSFSNNLASSCVEITRGIYFSLSSTLNPHDALVRHDNAQHHGNGKCRLITPSAINRYKVDGRRALKPPLGSASTSRAAPHRFVSPSLTVSHRNEGGRCLTHLILTSPIDSTRERTRKDEKIEPCGRVQGGETIIIDRITRLSSRARLFFRYCTLQISCEHELYLLLSPSEMESNLNLPLLNRKTNNDGRNSDEAMKKFVIYPVSTARGNNYRELRLLAEASRSTAEKGRAERHRTVLATPSSKRRREIEKEKEYMTPILLFSLNLRYNVA
ncbi:hypothetical protein ALC53_06753 [Atta colombica]|uniref:Uncharacterized protein n=1 Tax=Atta colombica TaxID=520822 RepID=A0A151I3Q3_9HYME|nr:hypothetical protein ALC53_06753 [Atta colombica]